MNILVIGAQTSITDMMFTNAKMRGIEVGCAYAEGFRQVKTFSVTGSSSLLPGLET